MLSACATDQLLPLLGQLGGFCLLLTRSRVAFLRTLLQISILFLPTLILINLLFSGAGRTPVLTLPWGNEVMAEPLLYGISMLLKVIIVMQIVLLLPALVSRSDLLTWMLARFPKLGVLLTTSLASLPTIQRQLGLRYHILAARIPCHLPRLTRLRLIARLWQPLLHDTLQTAWQTSEILEARAFGTGPRSLFANPRWHPSDTLLTFSACLALSLYFYALFTGLVHFPDSLHPDYFTSFPLVLLALLSLGLLWLYPRHAQT